MTSTRISQALLDDGMGRGSRVAILADSSPAYALLVAGILKAGASVVPMPTLVAADAISPMLADSNARAVFVSQSCRHLLRGDATQREPLRITTDFAEAGYPTLREFTDRSTENILAHGVTPDDEFNVIYSSGTTGRPKGIIHSHRLRAQSAASIGGTGFPNGVRTLIATAAYSNWSMGALIYTLWAGGCVRYLEKFSPASLMETCGFFRPDNVYLVPVQIARLLDGAGATASGAPPPARKWCAGSFLPSDHKRDLMAWWPGGLSEIYGMTEGAPFTILDAEKRPDKLHTVGQSDPPEDVKIIGDDGRELPSGERGEVVGRIRSFMTGYNNDQRASEALIWRDTDGNAYCRSGDIGLLDDERFLQIVDRKKDMIISGGFNIYASDIEEVLLRHPNVREAAAFAIPSRKWGETPAAVVVLLAERAATADELLSWANERLGRLQRLTAVAIADELPRGSLGKVLRRELREQYRHLAGKTADNSL